MAGLIEWPDSQVCLECKHGHPTLEDGTVVACVKKAPCKFAPKEKEGIEE